MLLRLYNDDTPLVDSSKDRHLRNQNGNAPEPVALDDDLPAVEDGADDLFGKGAAENEVGDIDVEDESYDMARDDATDYDTSVKID